MAKNDERKEVFTVIDRGQNEKGWWVRIGSAWVNRDGSVNVKLDALPVNGTLHIRDPRTDEQRSSGRDERRAPEHRQSSWRGRPDR